jgi:hypothetical protein
MLPRIIAAAALTVALSGAAFAANTSRTAVFTARTTISSFKSSSNARIIPQEPIRSIPQEPFRAHNLRR